MRKIRDSFLVWWVVTGQSDILDEKLNASRDGGLAARATQKHPTARTPCSPFQAACFIAITSLSFRGFSIFSCPTQTWQSHSHWLVRQDYGFPLFCSFRRKRCILALLFQPCRFRIAAVVPLLYERAFPMFWNHVCAPAWSHCLRTCNTSCVTLCITSCIMQVHLRPISARSTSSRLVPSH